MGLASASDELLGRARERTRGNPKALEALHAILSADREASLEEILDASEGELPENVVHALVGEAFSRLDVTAQRVMQALAAYARPVVPAAIDHLLQPYVPGIDAARVLNRLVNMHFVRKEAGRYYLHPVDREHALAQVSAGHSDDDLDDSAPFSRHALWSRGADYFKASRRPRAEWKSLEDLRPQLDEIDLRCRTKDFRSRGRRAR